MTERIYVVSSKHGEEHLVRAASRNAALACVAREELKVDLAGQERLVELLTDGVTVRNAVAKQADIDDE